MLKLVAFLSLFILLFTSCGAPMGDQVKSNNLSVFFMESINREKAILFAEFWKENGFVGDREQFIQLDKNNGIIEVKLIERTIYQDENLTIQEEAVLSELSRTLSKEVFQEPVEIIITDNTFRPLNKFN